MFETFAALVAVGAIVWFWTASLQVREAAERACRATCQAHGVQFLDDTVALTYLGLGRPTRRLITLRRVYQFEFSRAGHDRARGSVTMVGPDVEAIYLPPDHLT